MNTLIITDDIKSQQGIDKAIISYFFPFRCKKTYDNDNINMTET